MARILIVDDDVSILDAVSLILEEEGFQVETTTRGDSVYHTIESFKPDLILLDVLMSGTDGRDLCKKLKDDENYKSIPLIMVSAHPSARNGALDCGANDFLPKPFELEELKTKIEAHLSPE